MNNFLKEYQEFYKDLKTLPARISKQVVEDLTQLITEKHMDLYDLISEQNYSCECSSQTNISSQMTDINNLLEQLEHIKKESERIAADNIKLRKDLEVAKETNIRVYNLIDKRNAQLEEANHSLNECKEKIERLDKIRASQLNTIAGARDNAIYWEKKYRELYTKYINLLRKRSQGIKNDKIKKKKEELDYSKKIALDRDVCLKTEQKNLVPFIDYIDHTASFATKNNWIVVSDIKLY